MSRYRGPVTRLSRRLGVVLFAGSGQSKQKAYSKKNYKPGQHGQKRFSSISEYNRQLQEKQKARFLYGITEKQSARYYENATKSNEETGIRYMQLLEQRLDNVIFRSGLANSRPQARQMVSHGLIKLNGRRVSTPSIQVKPEDIFEIREKSKASKLFEEVKKAKVKTPKWLSVDLSQLKGQVVSAPSKDDLEHVIDHQLITEYYSK